MREEKLHMQVFFYFSSIRIDSSMKLPQRSKEKEGKMNALERVGIKMY